MRLSVEPRSPAYVTLTARPLRMGILVPDIPGCAWQTVFRGALSSQVRVWGGSGNFVLPLRADTKDCEVFWALTELLDPDWWEVYAGSYRELEDLDASPYAAWRTGVDARLASCPEEERARILDEAHAEPLVDAPIPEELHRLLVTRGATLNHDGHMILRGPVSATGAPPYPAVDALELRGLTDEVIEVETNATPTLQLLAAAEFGCLSPDLREELDARGIRRRTKRPSSRELMRWLYDVRAQPGRGPFALAEAGLGWYRPRPLVRDSVTVVAGEEAWDFAFAYALRRAGTYAFWVPDSAFGSQGERETVHRSLVWLAERTGAPLTVTSVSDTAAGHALARAVEQYKHSRSTAIRTATWRESLPQRSNRLLVTNRLGRPEAMYLDDGATPHLRTPVPDLSDESDKLRWMTELEVRDWAPMRHHSLAPQLLGDRSSTEARVTRQGLAYEGLRPMVTFGVPLEQLTVQPVLRPLPLLQQLRYVAWTSLWDCELSEKGQFALAAAELFGGFTELCEALRDEDVGKILCAYLDADGPGCPLTDRRRYLSLEDFRSLELTRSAEEVLDSLRAWGVLRAGLVLKCARCRHTDWYRPRETDPTFECTRCAATRVPDRDSWLKEPEAPWHYRLDEVVFQFARHRGDLPALAAFERFDRSRQAIQFVPELTLMDPDGEEREIDLAVTEGSSLWLGEAFSRPRYAKGKSEAKRLRRLADAAVVLNARGIILATSAEDLAPETKEQAQRVFPGPWPALELRTCVSHLPRPTNLLDDAPADR